MNTEYNTVCSCVAYIFMTAGVGYKVDGILSICESVFFVHATLLTVGFFVLGFSLYFLVACETD